MEKLRAWRTAVKQTAPRLHRWGLTLHRFHQKVRDDRVSLVAAGMAFYVLLAAVPALATLVSIYGLFTNLQTVEQQVEAAAGVMPPAATDLLDQQLHIIVSGGGAVLGFSALIGFALTFWSATRGVKTLMTALDVVYGAPKPRGFLGFNGVAMLMTLGSILFVIVALAAVAGVPAVLASFHFPGPFAALVRWIRWPLLAGFNTAVLAVLYRYGVSCKLDGWHRVVWGAIGATVLWLAGSALFSWYVSNFGHYNETYGSLGAVVVLMLWFWLSSYFVLLGGEFNATLERGGTRSMPIQA